jgi:hypothetical protein
MIFSFRNVENLEKTNLSLKEMVKDLRIQLSSINYRNTISNYSPKKIKKI